MELHEIERVDLETAQRSVDGRRNVAATDAGQNVEVRHEFGVNSKPLRRFDPARRHEARAHLAVQLLDPGIDVGAIEGEDAGVEGGDQIVERGGAVDGPMAAGELPAAADDARDRIARRKLEGLDAAHATLWGGNGVAVVSLRRKRLSPMRLMRRRLGQLGSGQATSLSLVIQSLAMGRPLLGGEQRQHRGDRIDRKSLAGRQGQHFAAKLEIVPVARAAIGLGPRGTIASTRKSQSSKLPLRSNRSCRCRRRIVSVHGIAA